MTTSGINDKISRYHRFYDSDKPGDLLIVSRPGWPRKKNLFDYDFERGGHLEMAADLMACVQTHVAACEGMGDDFIPWIGPDFGIAINHALVIDVPVRFAEWTSWAEHPMEGPDGYKRLDEVRYNPANRWARRIKEMLQFWKERCDGSWTYAGHWHYSPLDMANALRGNDLFLDYYDRPEELTALLGRCTQAIIDFELDLRTVTGDQLSRIGMPFWGALGPRNCTYLSEDLMDMSGPELARQWGLPWTNRISERLGTITVHHHAMGLHVQDVIAQEVRNSLIQVSNDPNYPPTIGKVRELYAASGQNALMIDVSADDIEKHIGELREVRAIIVMTATSDKDQARRAIDLVRGNSNIR